MPFCDVEKYRNDGKSNAINIFYTTYGSGPIKVLMIIGLAGTHDSWNPQIEGLVNDESGIQVCAFDNRGMGRSSIPKNKAEYTTRVMANDALSVMDHLGWKKAHVFGHSMGGMIACKLAAISPDRILSLALLNVTGGGYECLPKIDRHTLSIALRFLRAKTPEQRADVDLDTHYTKEYLEEYVGHKTRRQVLYQEYVKGISATGMQSSYGFDGQINACWTHKVSKAELEAIRAQGFLISVIHGRHDVIAQISHAKRLAKKLYPFAKMIQLPGGHLVSHERTKEVNEALLDLIKASETKTSPSEWTNLSPESSGCWMSSSSRLDSETEISNPASNVGITERLRLKLLYVIGLFMVASEYMKRVLRRLKPVRIGTALSQ
ncbi:putative carboxylesterase [Helianthus debilis subsp. tardiflorus]